MKYIEQISHWQGALPEEALMHLIDAEEESKPLLQNLLKNALQNYKTLPEDYVGHIFALYLLAYFRDEAAFSSGLDFLKLPEPYPITLFHDLLTQSYPAAIASGYQGNPKPLYNLLTNPAVSYLSKVIALVSASILVNRKSLARQEYATFLESFIQNQDPKLLAVVAEEIAGLHLNELYKPIKKLYAAKAIDSEQFSETHFDQIMQSEYVNPRKFFLIDDIFEELNFS